MNSFIVQLGSQVMEDSFSETLLQAGFFYADFRKNTGSTSGPLRDLGFEDSELRSGSYRERLHPEDRDTYEGLWQRVHNGWEDELYCEYRLRDAGGAWRWIETHAVVVDRRSDGTLGLIVGVDREITSRKNAEYALRRKLHELREQIAVAESLRRVSTLVHAEPEVQESVRAGLDQLLEILPFDAADIFALEGKEARLLTHFPQQAPEASAVEPELIDNILSESYALIIDELEGDCPYGSCMGIPLKSGNELVGVALLWRRGAAGFHGEDMYPATVAAEIFAVAISNYRSLQKRVSELERDELTGFLTRKSFDRDIHELWRTFRGAYDRNCVVMIDIDHFKLVNDRYGHPVGDEVIRRIAEIVRSCVRNSDILARYGGEEFIAVLPHSDEDGAFRVVERIRLVAAETTMPGVSEPVTLSAGIATDADADTLADVIRYADRALYRAKESGRNQIAVF